MNVNFNQYFKEITSILFLFIERNFRSRFWKIQCTVLCVVLSLITAFPSYDLVVDQLEEEPFLTIKSQIKDPLHPHIFHSNWGYEEHLSLRITVPIIAHFLNLDILGCYILMAVLGFLFFYLVVVEIFKITNDVVCSILMALAIALCFPGKCFFNDYNGFFDGFAFFFLLVSITSRNPFIIFFSLLAASFTNERAYITSSFILLYHLNHFNSISDFFINLKKKETIAILSVWIIYPLLRYYLNQKYSLSTGTHGYGISTMLWNIDMYPIGIFFGLEFLWLLVMLMFICVYIKKQYLFLISISISLLVFLFVSSLGTDFTRSITFLIPCLFLALKIVYRESVDLILVRRVLFLIVALNSFLPTYIVSHEIYQFENIVLKLGRWII